MGTARSGRGGSPPFNRGDDDSLRCPSLVLGLGRPWESDWSRLVLLSKGRRGRPRTTIRLASDVQDGGGIVSMYCMLDTVLYDMTLRSLA
jgi:hypothetical protein